MNVKEAVAEAKRYIIDLLHEEGPTNVALEEVELDEASNNWFVTIGFSRPWDAPKNPLTALANGAMPHRAYKVIRISNLRCQAQASHTICR